MSLWLGILGGQITAIPATPAIATSQRMVWQWNNGFGTQYADPTPGLGGGGKVRFSPTGAAVAFSGGGDLDVRKWSSGFGTKFTNPATLARGEPLAFTPSGDTIMTATPGSPEVSGMPFAFMNRPEVPVVIYAYPWNDVSGFGTKFASPATPPDYQLQSADFSSNAVAFSGYSQVEAYPWSSSGFGTKYANPASNPAGLAYSVFFSSNGNQIAASARFGPRIVAWPFSSGFGTKYADPATPPNANSYGAAFNRSDNVLAVGHYGGSSISTYQWSSSGFGTRFANPASNPGGSFGSGPSFAIGDTAICFMTRGENSVHAYQWGNASGFGTKFVSPVSPNNGDRAANVHFSPI